MNRFAFIVALVFLCQGVALAYRTDKAECVVYNPSLKSSCVESGSSIGWWECENMKQCCYDDSSPPYCYRVGTTEFTVTAAPAPANPVNQPGANQQSFNQQQTYNQQPQGTYNQPATGAQSSNINNLLTSLGLPANPQYQGSQAAGQGALGTNVAAPNVATPNVPSQLSTADNNEILFGLGTRCQIANSVLSPELRESLQKEFACNGNEGTVSRQEADRVVQNLFGGAISGLNPGSSPQQPQQQQQSVGAQLPNYSGQPVVPKTTTNVQSQSNQQICNILKNANLGQQGTALELQYGCRSNNLFGANIPAGLPGLPSLLSLLGGTTEEENVVKEGSINPDLIPHNILTECIKDQHKYPTCRNGYDRNIYTSVECFNVGCIYFDTRCFRCGKVPASAYVLQDNADTCSVASGDRQDCPGYESFQLTTLLLSGQQQRPYGGFGANPFGSQFGGQFAGQFGGTVGSASLSTPGLNTGLSNNLGLLNLLRSSDTSQTNSESDFSPIAGRARDKPVTRQLNPLLLSALSGGTTSNSNLLSLLWGGDSGVSRVSDDVVRLLRSTCENKGCCWKKGGFFGGECYSKGNTFAKNCIPTVDSGVCGKSPANTFSTRIVGGSLVGSNTDRPWMALIRFSGSTTARCGGALICSQWIVTTASCLQRIKDATNSLVYVPNLSPDSLDVYIGTTDPANPSGTGTRVAIERIVVHPGFSFRQSYNDIALIKIRSLTFSSIRRPACLPPLSGTGPNDKNVVYFNGYGETGSLSQSPLRELAFTVKSDSHCRGQYPGALPLSGIFCAVSAANTDSCYGDGGSPVVQYDSGKDVFTLVGLNFGGSDNCDGSKPALFTKISTFMPWIAQTTNGCCALPGSRLG